MRRRVAALLVVISVSAGAFAEGIQGRGRGQDRISASKSESSGSIVVGFGIEERDYIVDWFHDSQNLEGLPAGLAKREQLPPGLQRQLAKNGKLPPGLESKLEPLPRILEAKLPKLPSGHRRIVIGGNVILLDETTSFIVDIITGIF
ncbi:MAG TPA: hypothetical protein VFE29_06295 [Terriglobia bacterium]|nr:hypothetical protein [Terriglobia bacterium]